MTSCVIREAAAGDERLGAGALSLPAVRRYDPALGRHLSRSVQQRLHREAAVEKATYDTVKALNSLGGFDEGCSGPVDESLFSKLAHHQIADLQVANLQPTGCNLRQEATELLRSCGTHGVEATAVVPFARGRVAWPKSGVSARMLLR